jgi:hypothetical protein
VADRGHGLPFVKKIDWTQKINFKFYITARILPKNSGIFTFELTEKPELFPRVTAHTGVFLDPSSM